MLTVPPTILDLLDLAPGAEVALAVAGGRIVIEPCVRPRYALDELLAQCDASAPVDEETRDWLDAPAVGDELL
ncbi:MAG TPA: antitoxin [Stellaceae bacterium]|nr:antitoxin [Stellaceae bacterium]